MVTRGEAGFHNRQDSHTRQSDLNNRKLGRVQSHQPCKQPSNNTLSNTTRNQCPECGSMKLWKDGLRYPRSNEGIATQRWLCRGCGYRFSQPEIKVNVESQILESPHPQSDLTHDVVSKLSLAFKESVNDIPLSRSKYVASHKRTTAEQGLNILRDYNSTCRVRVSEGGAKNLAEVEARIEKQAAGATEHIQGYLATFGAKQLMMGLKEKTVKGRLGVLSLLHKRGADLFDTETVFKAIDHAKKFDWSRRLLLEQEWSEGAKNNAAQAYLSFCQMNKIAIPSHVNFHKWSRQPQKIPWIPLEKEIDQLIAGCSRKVAAFIQLLKETGARSGEAWRLKWTDIDVEHAIITFNSPEKGSNARQFRVSQKLIAMLNLLPKVSQKVWGDIELNQFRKNFMYQRRRIANKVQSPRIDRITFHTLRHYYGTMEYHKTKDILHVQERLGHRSITSTLIYTHLVNFEGDEYHTATAKTLKEDEELLKAGFEYVTERDGIKIYRKRK